MAFVKVFSCRSLSSDCLLRVKGILFRSFPSHKTYTRVTYKMKSAYFQNTQGEEKVHISISFSEFNTNEVLRFDRHITETLDDFLKRLESKVRGLYEKKILKKARKSAQSGGAPLEQPSLDLFFSVNNQRLTNEVHFEDIFSNKVSGDIKLRIAENDYNVIVNSPIVNCMKLPKSLKVGGIAYPEKFESYFTSEEKSEFLWFRGLKHKDVQVKSWEKCGEGYYYNLREEDYGHFMKLVCTPRNFSKEGPTYEAVSASAVERMENTEEIEKRHELTKEKTGDDEFRIVTYNILADCYTQTKEAKDSIFTFCDESYLEFDYRKPLLNFELSGYNMDIACLQEVDRSFYKNDLIQWFTGLNYCCLFHEKDGTREGCAILYNPDKFRILSANKYTFTNELLSDAHFCNFIKSNDGLEARLQNIQSLIQVVVFQSVKKANHVVIVGNTHFYFHPNADHIRLLQGVVSCKVLSNTATEFMKENPEKTVSVLLCGDFNSVPENGVYHLLTEGSVDENHPDWKSCENEEVKNLSFSHTLKFRSAYEDNKFTNFTPLFKGCLDYIYFQKTHLELKQTVPIPSEETLSRYQGIPSKYFPSDHVALVADLKFRT